MSTADLELYWFRHGESELNPLPIFSGRSNHAKITELGVEQSKRLGQYLKKLGIVPSVVYVSPAIRCIQTAEYALAEMGLDIEPLIHDALQELDQGDWVGKDRAPIWSDAAVIAEIERLGKDYKQGGAESVNDAARRGLGWIAETFDTHLPQTMPDRQFIFSHAVLISSMVSHFHNLNHQQTKELKVPNGSVTVISRRDGNWGVDYVGLEPQL
jgi:broad specificity phosphatase PhoE